MSKPGKAVGILSGEEREQLRKKDLPKRIEPIRASFPARMSPAAPKPMAEVAFTEWTQKNNLRRPRYPGLRKDKRPEDVHREVAR